MALHREALIAVRTDVAERITQVRKDKLTYLSATCLKDLSDAVQQADREKRPGIIVEAGAALGGSAIVMALAKSPKRLLRVYDVFGMIPPPSDKDGDDVHKRYSTIASQQAKGIGGSTYYGYRDDLLGEVTQSFKRYGVPVDSSNVELIKGYFEDTIHLDGPVALAHLDGDWYESTMTCLQRIEPHLVPGGRLVIDDYYKWSGCRRAVDEYFDGRDGYEFVKHGRLHIVKDAVAKPRWRRWWRREG
jgi:hypothetical protein